MKLSPEERAERRESFRQMGFREKLDYVFSYYKLELVLALVAVILVGDVAYRQVTRKEALLYCAYINISAGGELEAALSTGFVDYMGVSGKKNEVYVYRDLYIAEDPSTDNHQYAYASRLKLLASVEAKKLDVVLMNREAYDILSRSGYLYALPDILPGDGPLYPLLEQYMTANTVILEDNSIEYNLNEADTYEVVSTEAVNGLDVSDFPMFRNAGFSDRVYLGIIGNSRRLEKVFEYIAYMAAA